MGENKESEGISGKRSFLYEVTRVLTIILFHTLMPVKFHGREKLDREPPFIMIANHRHALDPLAMAMGVPKKQVVFLAKKELGKNKLAAAYLSRVHCIMVDRHNTDMEAMRACMKAIKMKQILVIFPEGTRHHEGQMEQIENGTSLIAMRSRSPVIPLYFREKLRFFHVTHIFVGDPIEYGDLLAEGINTETCEKMNERMRETYRKMITEAEKDGTQKN